MLQHDIQGQTLLQYLVSLGAELWRPEVQTAELAFTIIVFDRTNRARVVGANGVMDELAETNPVHVSAANGDAEAECLYIYLYCHVLGLEHGYAGFHYDWLSAS
jgi:hypothetical protein